MMSIYKNIICIIVLYKTDLISFERVLKKHIKNFSEIILVNNSPEISFDKFKSKEVIVINNPENIGLSAALNVGIQFAKEQGFKMVALFDQDTQLPPNFTKDMLHLINHYQNDKPVAVYSPIYYNHVVHKLAKHIKFKFFRLIRSRVDGSDWDCPHFVITSGSIIPIDVFDKVGLMREDLFIDLVDVEWCLRARHHGYEVVAFNKVIIDHFLGDYAVRIMGYSYPIHSPIRMYYYFRNTTFIHQLCGNNFKWRFTETIRDIFRFLFYMLFVRNRLTYFKYIIKGYYHGFIKKMGKLEE
jgi:rhamnosyltransferase